jgi:hypothetical protein
MKKKTIIVLIAIALSACSAFNQFKALVKTVDGMTYLCPKGPVVTITVGHEHY